MCTNALCWSTTRRASSQSHKDKVNRAAQNDYSLPVYAIYTCSLLKMQTERITPTKFKDTKSVPPCTNEKEKGSARGKAATYRAGPGRNTASSSSRSLTRALREFLSCKMSFNSGRVNRGRSSACCSSATLTAASVASAARLRSSHSLVALPSCRVNRVVSLWQSRLVN